VLRTCWSNKKDFTIANNHINCGKIEKNILASQDNQVWIKHQLLQE
jgi:hypothetical protein